MQNEIFSYIDSQRQLLIDLQRGMTAIPAISPDSDGSGEAEKALFIKGQLARFGFPETADVNAPDSRVPAGFRPNFYTVIPGRDTSKTIWVVSHIDVVPPGDLSLWRTKPYELAVDGDFIYGRGVEDNQQAIVSGIVACKALLDLGIVPACNVGLLFLSDEETNNHYGAHYVAENASHLFGPDDVMLIPDFGNRDGSLLEIAEKGVLWLKFTVEGKQCHGSTPDEGVNSLVGASDLVLRMTGLNRTFDAMDDLFNPPVSTFTPTRKDANVPNINTIPGKDVFYMDCRLLPALASKEVLAEVERLMAETEAQFGVKCGYEIVELREPAPASDPSHPFIQNLVRAARDVHGIYPKPGGIGGNTVAAVFRKKGIPCVVWARLVSNAHMPNECSCISWALGDAKVISSVALVCGW